MDREDYERAVLQAGVQAAAGDWAGCERAMRQAAARVLGRALRGEAPLPSRRAVTYAGEVIFVLDLSSALRHSNVERVRRILVRLARSEPGLLAWLDRDRGLRAELQRLQRGELVDAVMARLARRIIEAILGPPRWASLPDGVRRRRAGHYAGRYGLKYSWWVPLLVATTRVGTPAQRARLWLRILVTRTVPTACPECGDGAWRRFRSTGKFEPPPFDLIRQRRPEYCTPRCRRLHEKRRWRRDPAVRSRECARRRRGRLAAGR